jgi:hypothetical protein
MESLEKKTSPFLSLKNASSALPVDSFQYKPKLPLNLEIRAKDDPGS